MVSRDNEERARLEWDRLLSRIDVQAELKEDAMRFWDQDWEVEGPAGELNDLEDDRGLNVRFWKSKRLVARVPLPSPSLFLGPHRDEVYAQARLIAAAPLLFRTLRKMLPFVSRKYTEEIEAVLDYAENGADGRKWHRWRETTEKEIKRKKEQGE